MAATEAHTEVFTSSWERRNSGLTRPSVSAMHRCSNSGGGSETRSRVARSTSRYSSSSPNVNEGSALPGLCMSPVCLRFEDLVDAAGLGEVVTLDKVDADVLQHGQHLCALHFLGDRGDLHGAADLGDGLDHAAIHHVRGHVRGELPVDLQEIHWQGLQIDE